MSIFARILSLLLFFEISLKGSYSIKVTGLEETYEISEGAAGRTLFKLDMELQISDVVYKIMDATVDSIDDSYNQACALYKLQYNVNGKLELTLGREADYEIEGQRVCIGHITIKITCPGLDHLLMVFPLPIDGTDCENANQYKVTLKLTDEVLLRLDMPGLLE